jgi:hypothetical protein
MKRLASKKGMVGPAKAIVQELDGLKLNAVTYEAVQDRLHSAPLAIEGGAVVEEIADDDDDDDDDDE